MKFRHCPVHFLRKVGIPTLSKSIPTLRTEYISRLFPLYNSRIVRYNSRIGGQSRNSYFAQVQFRNRTDSYFAQNIYISQLIRFARVCNHVTDFNARNKCLTAKLLQQGYRYHKLRKTFSKFYRRHYELISKYNVWLKTLLNEGLSEPEFYGDLVFI